MSDAASLIRLIAEMITFAIFIRVILSWFMINPRSGFLLSIYQVFYQITEPIMGPLRRIVPSIGMFDLSPIVAIILIQIIGEVLARLVSGA